MDEKETNANTYKHIVNLNAHSQNTRDWNNNFNTHALVIHSILTVCSALTSMHAQADPKEKKLLKTAHLLPLVCVLKFCLK